MATEENKVVYGLDKVHIAFCKTDAEGATTWEEPKRIVGAVELTMDAEGDQIKKYADNGVIFTVNANTGYTGTLVMTNVPSAVLARMLGWKVDKNGALVEIADGVPEPFAMLYDVQGDATARHGVTYCVTANRPGVGHKTNEDSIEFADASLPITATPVQIGEDNVVKATMELSDTNKEAFGAFFNSVYTPEYADAPGVGA